MTSFFKENQNLLIVLALIVFAYWGITSGLITIPNIEFPNPQSIVNVNTSLQQPETTETTTQTTTSHPDLRNIFLPYINATNLRAVCPAYGGQWIETPTTTACYNATLGNIDCSTALVNFVAQQCIAVEADFGCNVHNIYCRYT